MKYNELNEKEKYVIENKGTEYPFTGIYNDFCEKGVFTCKKCDTPLYRSEDKFKSCSTAIIILSFFKFLNIFKNSI